MGRLLISALPTPEDKQVTPLTRRAALLAASACLAGPAVAAETRRILVFGDSQAQGLAAGFMRYFRSDRETRVLDRSKIGTGLSRLAFDWPAQAQTLATTEHATVAFALFGANDRPPVRGGGEVNEAALRRFTDTYAERVAAVATPFRQAGVPLVWVGHPIVRDPAFAEDVALLNDIFADSAAAEAGIYVSTWDTFKGPDGQYAPYGRGVDGQTVRLRADDGVHLTPAGYDILATLLVPELDQPRRG